jgi:hypothetical protein
MASVQAAQKVHSWLHIRAASLSWGSGTAQRSHLGRISKAMLAPCVVWPVVCGDIEWKRPKCPPSPNA